MAPSQHKISVSDTNEGPVVNIAAWLGMTVMIIGVFTRIGSKFSIVRRWTVDDTIIFVTMVFAIAHTVTLSMIVSNGLGQPQENLTEEMITNFQKFGYASQLLYTPTLSLGKLSTLFYLRALAPGSHYAILNLVLEGVVILWGISAEFATAFQCTPTRWAIITSRCFDTILFWNIIGAFDILTDIIIVILPGYLVWALCMPRGKKFGVFIVFATRIIIVPLAIFRLYLLSTTSSPSQPDQTLSSYHAYLLTTIDLNTAVFAACLPFLKPFIENLSSGALSSSIEPMDSSYSSGLSSKLSTFLSSYTSTKTPTRPSGSIRMSSMPSEPPVQPRKMHSEISPSFSDFHYGAQSIPKLRPDNVGSESYARRATPRRRSSVGSDKMIITRTREWGVKESEDERTDGYVSDEGEWAAGGNGGRYAV
ncbi:hypothetical protein LHYA1_G006459 [Lachnellula hyalina]|uniref:Rhodopsin domain-containing protein n=1 Tax=Lachnellula hyalina TaxID=1316788 RepID=A0A8H8TYL6_9HELO|nr:uncharacterized protein LHYA1_G006459 [Lachnellula hyalina]TVY25042.1 hypothetical protein LHYA1_G006459 [Lachnellula hyalina]